MAAEKIVTIEDGYTVGSGSTPVEIFTTKLTHVTDKSVVPLPIPRQKDGADGFTGDADTYLIDLGRVKELINIDNGLLVDDATSSALAKKVILQALHKNKRKLTISWGTGDFLQSATGNILKCSITESPGIVTDGSRIGSDADTGNQPEKGFSVILGFIVGTDK